MDLNGKCSGLDDGKWTRRRTENFMQLSVKHIIILLRLRLIIIIQTDVLIIDERRRRHKGSCDLRLGKEMF